MADMTVTWKGAVSFDAFKGQAASSKAGAVLYDSAAMAAGFDIRPLQDVGVESALKGAVPYSGDDGSDFSWVDEYEQAVAEVDVPTVKRGRPKKEG